LDPEAGLVVAVMDTERLTDWVADQRPWPGHPGHVPGAVVVQATATLGNLHAVYCLGLKLTDGWVGFGTHLKQARFGRLGTVGPPVTATLTCTRARKIRGVWFTDYQFRFEQEGEAIYTSEQTAAWTRTDHRGPVPG
ncbi:MAG: hypothetical protein ACI9K2_003202, partial [Myxococcota bacterium]